MKRYVYDGEEVFGTGRTAIKQQQVERKAPSLKGRKAPSVNAPDMVEIKPIDTTNGAWTKWVPETDLYEIVDNSTE